MQSSPSTADHEDVELIERLRAPDGPRVRDEILARLTNIERRLAHEGSLLQSASRMREILAAKLAVQNASAILNRIATDPGPSGSDSVAALQQIFRRPSNDQ